MKNINTGNPKYLFVSMLSSSSFSFRLSTFPGIKVSLNAPSMKPYLASVMIVSDFSPYSYVNESTIYSNSKTTLFREFLLIIDPFVMIGNEKKFIVSDTLRNVVIRLDNKPWGIFNSFEVDTSIFQKQVYNNILVSSATTKYFVIAPYITKSDTLKTAGDYSSLLNNYLTLEPGNYIFEVISFDILRQDGTLKKVKPFIVVPVEVKENTRNAFVGEFEVLIN